MQKKADEVKKSYIKIKTYRGRESTKKVGWRKK